MRGFPLRLLAVAFALALFAAAPAAAQTGGSGPGSGSAQPAEDAPVADTEATPVPKPDMQDLDRIRFLTDSDYPPFNYLDEEGELTGFNVDLMRALCDELAVECDISTARWQSLLPLLNKGEADAVAASIRTTEKTLEQADFTNSYYYTPARFAAPRHSPHDAITPEALKGVRVAVVAGTAHEAYLRDFFPDSEIVTYEEPAVAKTALREGEVALLFGDGISLMFWLNGTASNGCCAFRGGPFAESRYFGSGIGIAVRKDDRRMRDVLNYGLYLVRESGRLEELFLRYFPLSFF